MPTRDMKPEVSTRTILLLGCSESGKSTFLESLRDSEKSYLAPTVGVTVETIKHKSRDWRVVDVGGNGMTGRTLSRLREFHGRHSVVIYFCDRASNGVRDIIASLQTHLDEMVQCGTRYLWVVVHGKSRPAACKEDDGSRNVMQDVQKTVEKYKKQVLSNICFDEPFATRHATNARQLLDQIRDFATQNEDFQPSSQHVRHIFAVESRDLQSHRCEEAIMSPTALFATLSDTTAADSHVHRLRDMFHFVTEHSTSEDHIMDLTDMFLDQVRGTTQHSLLRHKTLVSFWLRRLMTAMKDFIPPSPVVIGSRKHFMDLIISGGQYFAEDAWRTYYSDQVIWGPWSSYRLPDLCDLWCQHRIALNAKQCIRCRQKQVPQPQERLPRYGYAVVQAYMTAQQPRHAVLEIALANFQSITMRQRSKNPGLDEYSETQTYFWIQHIHQLVVALAIRKFKPDNRFQLTKEQFADLVQDLDYADFNHLVHIDLEAWKHHYSADAWRSLLARQSICKPDLKPLIVSNHEILSCEIEQEQRKQLWQAGRIPEIPSDEELSLKAALAFRLMENSSAKHKTTHLNLLHQVFAYLVEDHGNKHSWTVDNVTARLLADDVIAQEDKVSAEEFRFWVDELVSILSQKDWKPPKSAIGNETSIFEQFRIVMNDNLWLVHESLFDAKVKSEQRLSGVILSAGKGEKSAEVEGTHDDFVSFDGTTNEDDDATIVIRGGSDKAGLADKSEFSDAASTCDTKSTMSDLSLDAKSDWEVVMI